MDEQWRNTKTKDEESKERERYGISRARRHRIIMRVLFIYLIIDIIVDFKLL